MQDTVIEARDLVKTFRKTFHAVDGVSLALKRGKFYAVMGHSGSGKTTLLQILGLLDDASSGYILVNGVDASHLKEKEKAQIRRDTIGFVFQAYYLNPKLKAYENVMLPMYINPQIGKEAKKRAKELLAGLGLEDRMDHYPKQMSGGEQQRVAIARALAKNPKLLLCDEPTGALDYVTGKSILKLLQDTCRQQGMTVVVITHNSAIAPMADQVIHVKNGRVERIDHNDRPVPVETIEW